MFNVNIFQKMTDQVIAALEKGVSGSGKCPWDNMSQIATNAITGRRLTGISQLACQLSMLEYGFKANRWLTLKAANSSGGTVIRGSKSTTLYWLRPFMEIEVDGVKKIISPSGEALSEAIDRGDVFWSYRFAQYFNVEQVSGLPEKMYRPLVRALDGSNVFCPIDEAESYIQVLVHSCGLVLKHEGSRAYYVPKLDVVIMPEKALFYKSEGYYGTALHEIGHWSGAESRLKRPGIVEPSKFGSDRYAFEELVAELIATFKAAELGVERSIDESHIQYLAHWLKILKNDNKAIFKASQEAMKAVNYLNNLYESSAVDAGLKVEVA